MNLLKADYNAESLKQIIIGLDNSIKTIKEIYSFDGFYLLEKSEPVFGMAFIAFQNYINSSIKDLFNTTENKTSYYILGSRSEKYERSNIELIIALANYIKHKDESKLHKGTQSILDAFNLKPSSFIEESPIFGGLSILDEKWDIFKVYEMVTEWRKDLFKESKLQYGSLLCSKQKTTEYRRPIQDCRNPECGHQRIASF